MYTHYKTLKVLAKMFARAYSMRNVIRVADSSLKIDTKVNVLKLRLPRKKKKQIRNRFEDEKWNKMVTDWGLPEFWLTKLKPIK